MIKLLSIYISIFGIAWHVLGPLYSAALGGPDTAVHPFRYWLATNVLTTTLYWTAVIPLSLIDWYPTDWSMSIRMQNPLRLIPYLCPGAPNVTRIQHETCRVLVGSVAEHPESGSRRSGECRTCHRRFAPCNRLDTKHNGLPVLYCGVCTRG
jgi:hypothetical protein